MVGVDKGEFEAIGRESYDRYLLDLAQKYAAEEERLNADLNPVIREIELKNAGEPNACFQIRTYNRVFDREKTVVIPLYSDEGRQRRRNDDRDVGDILMWARGG